MKAFFIIWSILAIMFLISWGIIITPVLLDAIKNLQYIIHNWSNNNTEEQPQRQIGFKVYDTPTIEINDDDDDE